MRISNLHINRIAALAALAIVALLAGCASSGAPGLLPEPPAADGFRELEQDARHESTTWNIAHQTIDERPWLGVDSETRLRLHLLKDQVNHPVIFRENAVVAIRHMLDIGAQNLRIDAEGLAPVSVDEDELSLAGQLELEAVSRLETPEECEAWLDAMTDATPGFDKQDGRIWRMLSALPAVPFVNAWISHHAKEEWRGENWRDFPKAVLYEPDYTRDLATLDHLASATDEELLALYAPIIAQEVPEDGPPDFRDDIPGRVGLIPNRKGDPVAEIDESRPSLYGHVTRAFVDGRWLNQMNYSFWYHDHPELKHNDPEAGRSEGQLIRITLDEGNRPLVSEAVYACGCYHRLYPLDRVEQSAERLYGDPEQGKYTIARHIKGRIDPIVPETGGEFFPDNPHPIAYVRSGFHLIAAVRFEEWIPAYETAAEYSLLPSQELEQLAWGGDTVSLYDRDGLVRGADRPEALMLYPSGIFHAGTPRAPGLHLVHFDQYDYDDPGLLETMLRIPLNGEASDNVADVSDTDGTPAERMRGGL
ncbi:hypothetical protein KQI84_04275 [bacterium]|nr:hypothetical protein [bacterium]